MKFQKMKACLAAVLAILVFSFDSFGVNFQQSFQTSEKISFNNKTDEYEIYKKLLDAFIQGLEENDAKTSSDAESLILDILKGAARKVSREGGRKTQIELAVTNTEKLVLYLKQNAAESSLGEGRITRTIIVETLTNSSKSKVKVCPFYPFC